MAAAPVVPPDPAGAVADSLRAAADRCGAVFDTAFAVLRGMSPGSRTSPGSARATRDFATSDLIRERLAGLGVEVRDTAGGAQWLLT